MEAGGNTAEITSPGAQAAAAINIGALMAATGVGVLTDIAAAGVAAEGAVGATDAAQITFQTAHYAARLNAAGVSVMNAEAAVGDALSAIWADLTGSTWGRLTVDNLLLEWRAMPLQSGTVSVGTIFPVVP